ncbi:MAG: DUF3120 domain-containing protein [Cyanobacteria bacterium J06588_5]
MQVLQRTTQHIKDVETLQISNEAPSTAGSSPVLMSNELIADDISNKVSPPSTSVLSKVFQFIQSWSTQMQALGAAAFLVAVPVFIQAPLVRLFPAFSLLLTAAWLFLGWRLLRKPSMQLWGDLLIGFSWTWLAGAIYWGWFRWDPYVHLPIEALGLPMVLILMRYGKAKIGNYFYVGSLLGTAITDLYFYCVGLIPYWKQLMMRPPSEAGSILHSALLRMETYQGVGCAIVLLTLLIMLGTVPLRSPDAKWWAFSGAVLSTILVDSLFFVAAVLA